MKKNNNSAQYFYPLLHENPSFIIGDAHIDTQADTRKICLLSLQFNDDDADDRHHHFDNTLFCRKNIQIQ